MTQYPLFTRPSNLENLSLKSSSLGSFSGDVFITLSNLIYLDLSGNAI